MYIQTYSKEFDKNVLWFIAEDENGLNEAFKRLCKDYLQISTKDADGSNKSMSTLIREVYKFFEGVKCLIVFDNADNSPWLPEYLPRGPNSQKPFVVITSRNREWGPDIEVLNLSELTPEEAMKMVKQGLTISPEDETTDVHIEELCKTLQYFPLALGQAISYISEMKLTTNYSAKEYLADYDKKCKQLLTHSSLNQEMANTYTKSTYTTWTITKNQIAKHEGFGKVAIQILEWMAYFNSDNIPRNIFQNMTTTTVNVTAINRGVRRLRIVRWLFPSNTHTESTTFHHPIEEEVLKGSVRLLVQYSLLNANGNQIFLSIHRLVQLVIRMDLEKEQREEAVLNELLPHLYKIKHITEGALDQAIPCWKYAFNNDTLLKKYCKHLVPVAQSLESKGRHQEVISFTSSALDHLKRFKPKETNPDIEYTIFWLNIKNGISLIRLGRFNETKNLLEALVDKTEKTYGQQHEYTLHAMNSLALVLSDLGQTTKAIEMRRLLLKHSRTSIGSSENILLYKRNLANDLIKVNKFEEALELLKEMTSSDTLVHSLGDNASTKGFLYAKVN